MEAYGILAKYYDRLMGDFDYDGYYEFVKSQLFGEGIDLACGSGEMTLRLAADGRKMAGADISAQMLNIAMQKAKKSALDIKWLNMDMLDLELNHSVDFITCVCDGLNYIPKEKIAGLFEKIKVNLKDGGKFIFDISTKYKLEEIIGDNLFCEDYDDVTYIWSNALGKSFVDMDIDFFERIEGDVYRRVGESHRQYIHDCEFLKKSLVDWNVEIYDGEKFCLPNAKSRRLIFIATKR